MPEAGNCGGAGGERRSGVVSLPAAEQRLRTVVDGAPVILFALDRDGIILISEGSGLRALGLAPGEQLGRSVYELYPGNSIRDHVRRALAGETFDVEAQVGELRYETRYAPLLDGGEVTGVLGVATDVTERKLAEQRLRESEARLQSLVAREHRARAAVEEAERCAAFLAETGRTLAGSIDYPATLARVARLAIPYLADWCVVDLIGKDGSMRRVTVAHGDPALAALAEELMRFTPDLAAREGVPRVIRTGEAAVYSAIDPDLLQPGRDGPVGAHPEALPIIRRLGLRSYMAVPMRARERTLGVLTFVAVDDRRRYGDAEVATARALALQAALAVDNARLYRDAQEAVRAREDFLTVASHELRTPLTSLHLAVQSMLLLLRSRPPEPVSPDFAERVFTTAERQSTRLRTLVERLLDVARAGDERLDLRLEEVDLARVARDVAAELREDLARAGCALTLRADEGVVGRWDRVRIEQVVTHLLSNAIRFGAGKPIEVVAGCSDGIARVEVRDHGIGIPPARQERIFDRFERTTGSRYGGLGLGLYVVRRTLAAFGGSVEVTSRPGEGSTFTVLLPCRPGTIATARAAGD